MKHFLQRAQSIFLFCTKLNSYFSIFRQRVGCIFFVCMEFRAAYFIQIRKLTAVSGIIRAVAWSQRDVSHGHKHHRASSSAEFFRRDNHALTRINRNRSLQVTEARGMAGRSRGDLNGTGEIAWRWRQCDGQIDDRRTDAIPQRQTSRCQSGCFVS